MEFDLKSWINLPLEQFVKIIEKIEDEFFKFVKKHRSKYLVTFFGISYIREKIMDVKWSKINEEKAREVMNWLIDEPTKLINRSDLLGPVIFNIKDFSHDQLYSNVYLIYNQFPYYIEDCERCYRFTILNENLYYASIYFHLLPLKRMIDIFPKDPGEREKFIIDVCTRTHGPCFFPAFIEVYEENKALRAFPGGPDYQKALQNFNELK